MSISVATAQLATPGLWLTGIERGLMLAGLAVALGGLAGRGVARQYKGERPAPLPSPWAVRGSLLGLAAAAALALTAVVGPGLAVKLAMPRVDWLGSDATVRAAVAEAACFGLAAIALRLRRTGLGVLALCGVVLVEGLRSHPEGVIPAAGAVLTYCHLLPAVTWAGMLLYTLRVAVAWRAYPSAMQGIVGLYARAAAWLLSFVLLTGLISALVLVPIGSLLTTAYGLFLIAKAVVVCIVVTLAVAGQRWLRTTAAAGVGPATVTRLECAGLATVVMITGLLTVLTPPAKPL